MISPELIRTADKTSQILSRCVNSMICQKMTILDIKFLLSSAISAKYNHQMRRQPSFPVVHLGIKFVNLNLTFLITNIYIIFYNQYLYLLISDGYNTYNNQMRRQPSLSVVHLGQSGELVLPQVRPRFSEKQVSCLCHILIFTFEITTNI